VVDMYPTLLKVANANPDKAELAPAIQIVSAAARRQSHRTFAVPPLRSLQDRDFFDALQC
jgi:hypothetical protein